MPDSKRVGRFALTRVELAPIRSGKDRLPPVWFSYSPPIVFCLKIVTGFAASVAQQSCRANFMKTGLRLLDQWSLFLTIVMWICGWTRMKKMRAGFYLA